MKNKKFTTKHITRIGILASISAVLLFFNFPIGFTPFYKIDFADIPCLLCGFALGPISGSICSVIAIVLNIILEGGSETGFVGEFAKLLMSLFFVLTSSLIYKKYHTKKGAMISLLVGVLVMAIISSLLNYYVLLPLYGLSDINFSFIVLYTFPFNVVKGLINGLIIILIYKRISPLLKDVY